MDRRGRRGLTLLEALTALALVAILTAIAVSGWGAWRERVMIKTAQENIIAVSMSLDTFIADNGAPPDSLAAVGRLGLADPWGNAYVYTNLTTVNGKGKARKDHSLVPLNSDYDLFSKGPDGQSASALTAKSSRDDILRANNGRFIGPASLY
jgi:general secretion pathway protein G